jgi:hypothetical protein
MALVNGIERTAAGALVTSSAAPATSARRRLNWAISASGAAHRVNATAGLPAGAVLFRGRAYSLAGAVCFTTTRPAGVTAKYINGICHDINGAMYVKTAVPTKSARSGPERLLIDPADGAVIVDSTA